MSLNDKLLAAIKARSSRKTEFNYGITTADRYVRTLKDLVGIENCYKFACTKHSSFNDVLEKSARTLVYANPEMEKEQTLFFKEDGTDLPSEIEAPKNTLMLFRHVLTTPKKDRDGDVLRTQGAEVDPKMLLLWQHVHTLPIGKMVSVAEHTENKLSLVSAIVDMNELSHDAAVMIDNDMGRFSHGFRAMEFDELKEEEGEVTSPGGFDIKRFEIMEASLVSVPSNTDAETEEILLGLVESEKLTSRIMKECGKSIRERHPLTVGGVRYRDTFGDYTRSIETGSAAEFEKVFKLIGGEDDEDKSGSGGTKGSGEEGETGASEETEGTPSETETEETRDTEVEEKSGPLKDSWEWVELKIKAQAPRFLELSQLVDMRERFTWVLGTFADHAVICAEHREYGVEDEFLYFKATWELGEKSEPRFTGDPEEVEIVTSVEIRERSPIFSQKNDGTEDGTEKKDGEKAGRTLSARNLNTLKQVRDDLKELGERESDMSRGGQAICERCVTKLGDLISSVGGDDEETSTDFSVKEAMTILLQAPSSERYHLEKLLGSLRETEENADRGKQFSALVSA